jgi:hypothetical protein
MPRQGCIFRCPFKWSESRPEKIKAHIIADHAEKYTAEQLEAIKGFTGRQILEFIGAYPFVNDA